MKTIIKYAATIALTGALALAAATPSEARHGRNAALFGGLAAGALIGAAAVSANNGYYYGPGYAEPAYVEPGYAYQPGYDYAPAPRYRYRSAPACAVDMGYGRLDYSAC